MLNANQSKRAHRYSGGRMKPPWRTVLFGDETGRFSREQLRDAVVTVMERRAIERERMGRPMIAREVRQERGMSSPRPEACVPPAEPVPYGQPRRGGRRRKAPPPEE